MLQPGSAGNQPLGTAGAGFLSGAENGRKSLPTR